MVKKEGGTEVEVRVAQVTQMKMSVVIGSCNWHLQVVAD